MFKNREIFDATRKRILSETFDTATKQSIFRDPISNKMLFSQDRLPDGTSVFKDAISNKILGWKK